jgi:hypothetical protein
MRGLWRAIRGNPVALLALFLSLAGTSYAAATLAANSVGTRQLKKDAVTSAKVKNRSLRAVDFARAQLPRGAQGAQGERGLPGPVGPPGATVHQAGIANPVTIDGNTPATVTILNPSYTQGANESDLFIAEGFATPGQGTTCGVTEGMSVVVKLGDQTVANGFAFLETGAGSFQTVMAFRIAPGSPTPRTLTVTASENCAGAVTLNSFGIDVLRYGN